jgi:hypothetical protein
MQTITTRYLGPTETRGSRFKATQFGSFGGGPTSITLPYSYADGIESNHWLAASALIRKLGWPTDEWHAGGTPTGMVFVLAGEPLACVTGEHDEAGSHKPDADH